MRGLVRVYRALTSKKASGRAEAVVRLLGEEFPAASMARELKREILSSTSKTSGLVPLDEVDLLCAFVTTEAYEAFRRSDLSLSTRVKRLYAYDQQGIRQVLNAIKKGKQPIAEEILSVVADLAAADGFHKLAHEDAELVAMLARQRPSILQQPEVWRAADAGALWTIAAKARGITQRTAIVEAMIGARATLDPGAVVSAWGNGDEVLLRGLALADGWKTSEFDRWLDPVPVGTIRNFLAEAKQLPGTFAAAALRRLAPADVAKLDPTIIDAALEADASVDLAVAVFMAALGKPRSPTWGEIGINAFTRIAERASKDELGPARERLGSVESELPEWDVVARVARAANLAFRDGRWPSAAALTIRDRAAFAALIAADEDAGLARSVLLLVADGEAKATAWQNQIISESIRERSDRDSLLKTIEGLARGLFRF